MCPKFEDHSSTRLYTTKRAFHVGVRPRVRTYVCQAVLGTFGFTPSTDQILVAPKSSASTRHTPTGTEG